MPIRHIVVTSLGEMLGLVKGAIVELRRAQGAQAGAGVAARRPPALSTVLQRGGAHEPAAGDGGHDDIAFLQYTGGTTGSPGAMLTHRNIIANLQQAHAWIAPYVGEGREIIITALPLYHIFSLTANCLTFLKIGAKNVLIPNPRDIPGFIKELGQHRFTVITGVNTLFNALLNNPEFAKLDFSTLRVSLGGGMAVQQVVAEKWKKVAGCLWSRPTASPRPRRQ